MKGTNSGLSCALSFLECCTFETLGWREGKISVGFYKILVETKLRIVPLRKRVYTIDTKQFFSTLHHFIHI